MLIFPKTAEHTVAVQPLNGGEFICLPKPDADVLENIATVDLECFADPHCLETSFASADCYIVRTLRQSSMRSVGFIAITGLRDKHDPAPVIDTYIFDSTAMHAARYAQLGVCQMLLSAPGIDSVEIVLPDMSPLRHVANGIGFTEVLEVKTNNPRGPAARASRDIQLQLQNPEVLGEEFRKSSELARQLEMGWKVFQDQISRVIIEDIHL